MELSNGTDLKETLKCLTDEVPSVYHEFRVSPR